MPAPVALCIEWVDAPRDQRYVRCVADVGRRHSVGLGIDSLARLTWKTRVDLACELFSTADERLALLRPEGAVSVTVSRSGRSLSVPIGKPVILLDQDELVVADQRLRLHVHGFVDEARAPMAWVSSPVRRIAAVAATAVALSAAVVACKKSGDGHDAPPIDVRDQPPQVPAASSGELDGAADAAVVDASTPRADASTVDGADDAGQDAAVDAATDAKKAVRADAGPRKPPKIEVRDMPPYVD